MNRFVGTINDVRTENGHAAVSTTGHAVLDLYGQVGGLRNADRSRVFALIDAAMAENPLLTMKTIFYARDARQGVGERELFRDMIRYVAKKHPEYVTKNVELFGEYGRFDDLYCLVNTKAEDAVFSYIAKTITNDLVNYKAGKPISLMAKWLKSVNTTSEDSNHLGRLTASALHLTEKKYRKMLSMLRERIRVVEQKMSANEWEDINYEFVPSKAGLIYRNAFRKHDEVRYNAYIEAVRKGEKKINAKANTPQDLVHLYMNHGKADDTIEVMWKNLPDFVKTDENILCMADVSGSMYGRPLEVSIGLSIYFAQRNRGAFHNLFMTFSQSPSFIKLKDGVSLRECVRQTMDAPWGMNTDLNQACTKILVHALENKVPQRDMPRRLIIISDMEIDRSGSNQLHSDEMRTAFELNGYIMPQIIYWNVSSRNNHFQTRCDTPGVMLASGSSPAVFEALLEMKDYEETPLSSMLNVLNSERYEPIRI